jgi:alpha,alpha-trehalase
LLAGIKGDQVYLTYLPQLEKEYNYWMDGAETVKPGNALKSVVKLKDGTLLNRYWDEQSLPRQESYREDIETATKSKRNKPEVYQHLRAGAASGWDFSSRWFADEKNITTIETADIIPVDLNSLLYNLETVLSRANVINKEDSIATEFKNKAEGRRQAIDKYCWSTELKYYTDYNFRKFKITNQVTAAGLFPFCFFPQRQGYLSVLGRQAAVIVNEKLLQPGGLQTTTLLTGQQWDSPNGWAPLEWMAVIGLARCGQIGLAKEIANRWMGLNEKVYRETGKLMEKYNVADLSQLAGGGEYAAQDGFGWTNGVYLAMQAWLKQ